MAFVVITFTTALILNAAVLTLLKLGLRNSHTGARTGDLTGPQPC